MLVLYFMRSDADFIFWLSFIEMNDTGVDSSTASSTEHRNDRLNAPMR